MLDNRAALYKRVTSLSKIHKEVGVSRNHDPLPCFDRASVEVDDGDDDDDGGDDDDIA